MAKKKVNVTTISDDNEILKLVKLIIIVSLVVAVFYVITIFVNKKDDAKTPEDTKTPATIQYDYILAGNIFEQSDNEYYVLVKGVDDLDANIYESYLLAYGENKDSIKSYYVDIKNPLNIKFLKEESYLKTNDISKIKFKGTTLLLIKKGKISKYYEDKEDILNTLKALTNKEN